MNSIKNSQLFIGARSDGKNQCTQHFMEVGYFCVDEDCVARNRAACRDCIVNGQHKNHKTILLQQFYSKINSTASLIITRLKDTSSKHQLENYIKDQICNFKNQVSTALDQLQQHLNNQIEGAELSDEDECNNMLSLLFHIQTDFPSAPKVLSDFALQLYKFKITSQNGGGDNLNQIQVIDQIIPDELRKEQSVKSTLMNNFQHLLTRVQENIQEFIKGSIKPVYNFTQLHKLNRKPASKTLSSIMTQSLLVTTSSGVGYDKTGQRQQYNPIDEKEDTENFETTLLKAQPQYIMKDLHANWVLCVVKLRDDLIGTGSSDKLIKLYYYKQKKLRNQLEGHKGSVYALQIIDQENKLASASEDKTIKVWNWRESQLLRTIEGHLAGVYCLVKISDEQFVTGSLDTDIKLWNSTLMHCEKTFKGHTEQICCLVVLDDTRIASGSKDKSIGIWNFKNGYWVKSITGHEEAVHCLAKMGDFILASGSADFNIKLHNHITYECLKTFRAHDSAVKCLLALSNQIIISGGLDGNIKIWKVQRNLTHVFITLLKTCYDGHQSEVLCLLQFNQNEYLSSGGDRAVIIWQ